MRDRKERKRTKTPGHDASRKPNRKEGIVVEVIGRLTVARIFDEDWVAITGVYFLYALSWVSSSSSLRDSDD